jgi:hypothetical protein
MPKTLKQLCENDPELSASFEEALLQIGHHLVGEHIIDRTTARRIESATEMSAAHYVAEMLYNTVILPNGETFDEFLDSLSTQTSQLSGQIFQPSSQTFQEEYALS